MKKPLILSIISLLLVLGGVFLFTSLKDKDNEDKNVEETMTNQEEIEETETLNKDVLMKIDETEYHKEDVSFMKYMQMIQIERLENEGNDMSEKKRTQNSDNVQLQNIAELKMMSSLAEEKGFGFEYDKIKKEKEAFLEKYEDTKTLSEAKKAFGDDFDNRLHAYIEEKMKVSRVLEELEKDKKREFENISEEELQYEVAKEYQLLLEDERDDHTVITKK